MFFIVYFFIVNKHCSTLKPRFPNIQRNTHEHFCHSYFTTCKTIFVAHVSDSNSLLSKLINAYRNQNDGNFCWNYIEIYNFSSIFTMKLNNPGLFLVSFLSLSFFLPQIFFINQNGFRIILFGNRSSKTHWWVGK